MPPPSGEDSSGHNRSEGRIESTPVKKFTWKELSLLNTPENAHVAVRGKVRRGGGGGEGGVGDALVATDIEL